MLLSLHIENIAVIKRLDIDLFSGFTVLTGETGAGKSVMMDALKLLLGAKAERDLIRHGEKQAAVGAFFGELPLSVCDQLSALGILPDEEGCIEMLRVLQADGRSTAKINGRTVSLAVLKEATQALLHIHGQDDSSFLKRAGSELAILDAAAHNRAEQAAYAEAYRALCEIRRRMREIRANQEESVRLSETLRYQIEDIEEVAPQVGEEDALFDEKLRLRNLEKITKQTGFAYRALRGAPNGNACYILDRAAQALRNVASVVPEAEAAALRLEEYASGVMEIAESVRTMADTDGEDPEAALDRIETRLAAIGRLKRKYGGSEEAVLAFWQDAVARLARMESADADMKECEAAYAAAYEKTVLAAEALSESRRRAADALCREISETLHDLDMPRAVFRIELTESANGKEKEFSTSGADRAEFLIAVNVGEPAVPVAGCASGGEMSRIMLAIKSVIARHDGMPTVIFDEADTGVSGKTSRKIGLSFKRSSACAQTICTTHSAQIASLADRHLLVCKDVVDGRALSSVRELNEEERVEELARILCGIHVTEAGRMAARDMMTSETVAGE